MSTPAVLAEPKAAGLIRFPTIIDAVSIATLSTLSYPLACAFFHAAGGRPTMRLNARENAASDS